MKKIVVASTVLFSITFFLASCSKESMSRPANNGSQNLEAQTPGSTISATVVSGNTYILNLGSSGSATIIRQALHYQLSETVSDKEGDGFLRYKYTPEANYTGSDEVMINYTGAEISGSGNCLGNSHPTTVSSKSLTIKLNITN